MLLDSSEYFTGQCRVLYWTVTHITINFVTFLNDYTCTLLVPISTLPGATITRYVAPAATHI